MPWLAIGYPVRIIVPGQPRALERNRTRIVDKRDGTRFVANYLPAQSAREQSNIRKFAHDAMGDRPILDGPIDLRIVAFLAIPRSWSKTAQSLALADKLRPTGKPDADNVLKGVEDAMSGVVYRDDALITDTAIWKRYSASPRLLIEVRLLSWIDHTLPL